MSLKLSNVTSINFQLEDILPCKSFSLALSDLNDTQSISEAFYSACVALIANIHLFDDRIKLLPAFDVVSIVDVYESVEDLRPHFQISSTILKYRLLTFMCAHVQVIQLLRYRYFSLHVALTCKNYIKRALNCIPLFDALP